MNRAFRVLAAVFPLLCCAQGNAWSATPNPQAKTQAKAEPIKESAFTGATVREKVRLRLQPDLNAKVIKDLGRGELMLIVGEDNGFYRVKPDPDQRAYVYTKYVNNGKISGERVNIRLQPDLESPILIQLATGDQVVATAPPSGNWLEVSMPDPVVFYVAKEYIEKVGDANYLYNIRRNERELRQQTEFASNMSKIELQKPFEEIDLTAARQAFKKALDLSGNKQDKRAHIEQLRQDMEQAYAEKRDAYLSSKTQAPASPSTTSAVASPPTLEEELDAYHTQMSKLDKKLDITSPEAATSLAGKDAATQPKADRVMEAMINRWSPVEGAYFKAWADKKGVKKASLDDFYADQRQQGISLQGVLQPYLGQVKNRPGDFLLVETESRRPLAYLYSTQINLAADVGREVTIVGIPRNNNHFAYPAYYVLEVEK